MSNMVKRTSEGQLSKARSPYPVAFVLVFSELGIA